jgi:hypothetical protein
MTLDKFDRQLADGTIVSIANSIDVGNQIEALMTEDERKTVGYNMDNRGAAHLIQPEDHETVEVFRRILPQLAVLLDTTFDEVKEEDDSYSFYVNY